MSDDGEHPHDEHPYSGRTSQAAGRLIGGRYRLTERVGSGGMGTVWKAVDELVDREVAVKQPKLPGDADDPDGPENEARRRAANRLYREARAAARVDHPSAVTIHDVVVEDGSPWIVMELVRGESLHEVLERGALTPAESARIGLAVVGALHAAHQVGIVHRDVKPANVLLGPHGQVVLTDFGIAHVQGEESLTVTGEFVGSLEFVAPERMAGPGAAGPPSDLWSLGVLLYAAVEGWSPFRRTTLESTLAAILSAEPPEPERAGPLGPLLVRLLAKDPAERPDAQEAAGILEDVAKERAPDTQTPSELRQLGEDVGTMRLGGTPAGPAGAVPEVVTAAATEAATSAVPEAATGAVPEAATSAVPEAAAEAVPEAARTTAVGGASAARARDGRRAGRRVAAVAASGLLLAGGGAWAGAALDTGEEFTEVPEPSVGWVDARVASPSTGSTAGTTAGTRWVAHREKAMNAVLSLPASYERLSAEGGGDDQPRTVTYDGEKGIQVRLTQWDQAPASPMEQAKDSTDIVAHGVKAAANYTTTSFHDDEAVLADTTHSADGTPTRVMELIIRTDDSRMYELRVDMPKGTEDEKTGTALFKGARERLEIGTQ
ncbi:serine/threonine-protein kinase [Streptomyces sp. NPDC002787]